MQKNLKRACIINPIDLQHSSISSYTHIKMAVDIPEKMLAAQVVEVHPTITTKYPIQHQLIHATVQKTLQDPRSAHPR